MNLRYSADILSLCRRQRRTLGEAPRYQGRRQVAAGLGAGPHEPSRSQKPRRTQSRAWRCWRSSPGMALPTRVGSSLETPDMRESSVLCPVMTGRSSRAFSAQPRQRQIVIRALDVAYI